MMKYVWTSVLTLLLSAIIIFAGALYYAFKNKGSSDYIDERIYSEVLKENRILNIRLPWNYSGNPNQAYPLIIKMDGDARLRQHDETLNLLYTLSDHQEAIIVAIPNAIGKRKRDLTPSGWMLDDGGEDRGQGDDFLDFIEQEVIPHISSQYRVNGSHILFGYSRGGLMAVHGLIQKPETFDGAIALSPALWRDDSRIVKDIDTILRPSTGQRKFLFLAIGTEENDKMRNAVRKMKDKLENVQPPNLVWTVKSIESGNHQTTPILAIPHAYDALGHYLKATSAKDPALSRTASPG